MKNWSIAVVWILIIISIIWIFGSAWLFNHFNPWVGIGVFGIYIYLIIKQINKINN